MIQGLKAFVARHWPVLHFRTIIFGTLLFVAALPGVGAIFLRVYENALVRRTEAELVAQSAALAASAAAMWPGPRAVVPPIKPVYVDNPTEIDLSTSPVLPERPAPLSSSAPTDAAAVAVANKLAPAIAETKLTTLASILVLDRHGIILEGQERGGSLAALPEVRQALVGRPTTVFRQNGAYRQVYPFEWVSRASNLRLHHARPIWIDGKVAGVILISRSPRALFRGMYEDRGKIALGVATIFGLLIALSAILSRAIVRPIENLSRATRAMVFGGDRMPVRPSLQVVEIKNLYDDFGAMAEHIDRRSRYLRDFAASVSHEFKTPLAGIRGAIELFQDHHDTMSDEERARFLENIAADADRLSRLVRRLMELAQADMQLAGTAERTDVYPILTKIADGFRAADFDVVLQVREGLPSPMISSASLEAIATTLLENSKQAGASKVLITGGITGEMLELIFEDDGTGIPDADRHRVFDPFFTSKREIGGTGLGLAIARSLAEAHRAELRLLPTTSGTRMALRMSTADEH